MQQLRAPSGCAAQRRERDVRRMLGDEGDEDPLIRHVEWIEPKHLAGGRNGRIDGESVSSSSMPTFDA